MSVIGINAPSERSPSLLDVEEKYGITTGYFFTINCIVGAGILGLPWAYRFGGWMLGIITQFFFSGIGVINSFLLLDAMSRIEILVRMKAQGHELNQLSIWSLFTSHDYEMILPSHPKPVITARRFDYIEMLNLLYGTRVRTFFLVLLLIVNIGTQTAYVSIFASSFASNVPLGFQETCNIYEQDGFFTECRYSYWTWLAVYFMFMLYFSIKGLNEQVWMQIVMGVMRFVVVFLMVGTSLGDIAAHRENESDEYNDDHMPEAAEFENIGLSLPIIALAIVFQIMQPSVHQFIKDKERNLPIIIYLATITCTILYTMLGLIVPIAIPNIESMSTLGWRDYSAGHAQDDRPWWTYLIGYFVVLFPAFDVFSIFPIFTATTSDNLISIFFGATANTEQDITYKQLLMFRISSMVPPFLIAFFVYDLGFILDWTGLLQFLATMVGIPLIYLGSKRLLKTESPYERSVTKPIIAFVCAGIGMTLLILCFVLLLIDTIKAL